MTDVNIAFVSPTYGPHWAPVVASWLRLVAYTSRYFSMELVGKLGGVGVTDRMYTMTAENKLVEESLMLEPKFTHIFMVEMDMLPPHDAIKKLVELDKDIASGLYFLRSDIPEGRGQPCLYKKSRALTKESKQLNGSEYLVSPVSLFPRKEPFPVHCSGLGCILFKRKVFEIIEPPWFDLRSGDKKSIGYGSDIYFSKHVADAGLEWWVDPTIRCQQIDYYVTDFEDYEWQCEQNPKFASLGYIIGHGGNNGEKVI